MPNVNFLFEIMKRDFFLIAAASILSSYLLPFVLGVLNDYLIMPHLPKNHLALTLWIAAGAGVGAVIVALLLGFPVGYFSQKNPFFVGLALGITICIIHIVTFPDIFFSPNWLTVPEAIIQHVVAIVAFVQFVKLGKFTSNIKIKQTAS
jgi:magnesium-transporting ATPase (P-type)